MPPIDKPIEEVVENDDLSDDDDKLIESDDDKDVDGIEKLQKEAEAQMAKFQKKHSSRTDDEDTEVEETDDSKAIDSKVDSKETKPVEEEFIEVPYNKEMIKVPLKDRDTLIQKGLNYDKVYGKHNELSDKVSRLMKLANTKSIDELIERVDKVNLQSDIDRLIDDNPDMTEDEARNKITRDRQAKAEADEREKVSQEQQRKGLVAERKLEKVELIQSDRFKMIDKPLQDTILKEIDDMIENNPEITTTTAFKYLLGEHADEILQLSRQQTQKSTIADMHDKAKRVVDTSVKSQKKAEETLTPTQKKFADAMGVSYKDVARTVNKNKRT